MDVERAEVAGRHADLFLAHHSETLSHFHPGHLAVGFPGIADFYRGGNERLRRIEPGHASILAATNMTDQPMFIERHQFCSGDDVVGPRFEVEEFFAVESLPANAHRYCYRRRSGCVRTAELLGRFVSP